MMINFEFTTLVHDYMRVEKEMKLGHKVSGKTVWI